MTNPSPVSMRLLAAMLATLVLAQSAQAQAAASLSAGMRARVNRPCSPTSGTRHLEGTVAQTPPLPLVPGKDTLWLLVEGLARPVAAGEIFVLERHGGLKRQRSLLAGAMIGGATGLLFGSLLGLTAEPSGEGIPVTRANLAALFGVAGGVIGVFTALGADRTHWIAVGSGRCPAAS
jgi:hypothetical protein